MPEYGTVNSPNWGNTSKDTMSGASLGTSIYPGIGTAIGALGGYIYGGIFDQGASSNPTDVNMPNRAVAQNNLGIWAGGAQNRLAPQLDQGLMMQSRGNLYGVANRLGAIANGQQAGAGELAVNRQLSSAYAQQQSAARMARGANSALAARNAMRNSADMGLQGAGVAAQAQMQDQQAANQQLGQIYGQAYTQDTNAANMNMNARLSQQQMNDAYQIQAMGQILGWDQAQVNANLAKAGLPIIPSIGASLLQGAGQAAAAYGAYSNKSGGSSGSGSGSTGSTGSTGSGDSLMDPSYSDERVKKNIGDGSSAADQVLASMQPYVYEYQNPDMGAGQQLGVTTQDLQRAGLGQAVVPTPAGDAINPGKLAGANTAMLARLGDRVAALEGALTTSRARAMPAEAAAKRAAMQPIDPRLTHMANTKDEMLRSLGYGLPANYHPVVSPVVEAINARTAAIQAETARKNRALGLIAPGAYYPPGTFSGSIYPVGMGDTGMGASPNAEMGAQ